MGVEELRVRTVGLSWVSRWPFPEGHAFDDSTILQPGHRPDGWGIRPGGDKALTPRPGSLRSSTRA